MTKLYSVSVFLSPVYKPPIVPIPFISSSMSIVFGDLKSENLLL